MSAILHTAFAAACPVREAQAAEADRAMRRRADKIDPPPVLSRADQIIAEGERKRRAYRSMNPAADTAMVYGAQIGFLHGQVQKLCAELDQYAVTRADGLHYRDAETDVGTVTVGYAYVPGQDVEAGLSRDSFTEVQEVWCNGVDLHAWVPGDELDRIADEVMERHEAALRRDAEIGACRAED